jgi:16S rRNA processing protein RimM
LRVLKFSLAIRRVNHYCARKNQMELQLKCQNQNHNNYLCAQMKEDDFVEVAYITKTHGLKGEVQVAFSYDEPEKLKLKSVFIDFNGKMVPHFVSAYKISQKQLAYFLFEDINHIDKAQDLVKKKVFLFKKLIPKKKKEEFTYNDLEGFMAIDATAGELGVITEVRAYPQQFLATVNFKQKEVLFPLSEDLIEDIDIDNKLLKINLPEGLLDVYLES